MSAFHTSHLVNRSNPGTRATQAAPRPASRFTVFLSHLRAAAIVVIVVGCIGATTTATANTESSPPEESNPHVWKPRTRAVAVFKNGLGFFMREGKVALRDGWCAAETIPPAAFGTLAVFAQEENEVVDLVGAGPGEVVEFDDRDAPNNDEEKRQRLTACDQLKIQLDYKHKGAKFTAAGKLVSVGPTFAVLENEQNSLAVPVAGVTRLQILDLPLRVHVSNDDKTPLEQTRLGMAYLRKGITWIPDYTLKVLDENTAELTLRGTLVNEAEDLIHTDVHLVVGVPHFVHTEFLAPIAVGQVIRTIGTGLSSSSVPQAVMSQQMMNRAAIVSNIHSAPQFDHSSTVVQRPVNTGEGDLGKALGNLPQLGSAAATDYTVYTRKDLTLRRGEKAIITLLKRKITYSHVYRWSPPERMQHSLVLHNRTDTAWTTGPCLAVSGDRPLTEDLIKYTPVQGNVELPVTTAINIAHDKIEQETERKLKAYHVSGSAYFDLVTLEGKLQLKNFEQRSVHLVITNPVPGKPITANADGKTTLDPTKLKLDERQGVVRWDLTLKPGEELTLRYEYERYVRSY